MSSDQSKNKGDFEEEFIKSISLAGKSVLRNTVKPILEEFNYELQKNVEKNYPEISLLNYIIKNQKHFLKKESVKNSSFIELEKTIDKLIDEKEISLKTIDQALICLEEEHQETIHRLNLDDFSSKKIWWGLIYLCYEDANKFSARQIAWFLIAIYEKTINKNNVDIRWDMITKLMTQQAVIISQVLLENYFPECLEYRQADFRRIGFTNESIKKIDIFLKEFILTNELAINKYLNKDFKEFFLQFFSHLKELEPHIEINLYLQKDFFIQNKFTAMLCEWLKNYGTEELSTQDKITSFLNTNLDKYLSEEWETLKSF